MAELYTEIEALLTANQRHIQKVNSLRSRLDSIVHAAPNYIHIIDTDLRVQFINRGGEKYQPEDIIGTRVGDFMGPNDRARVRRKLRHLLKTGEPVQYEYPAAAEGERRWYRAYAGPMYTNGEVTGAVLITFDATLDQERMEALKAGKRAAEAGRAYDRALINSIGEGLIVVDENGLIANVNPTAARMLGYEPSELLGMWFPGMVPAVDDRGEDIDPLNRPAMRSLSTGSVVSEVIHYRRKDHTTFPVAVTISPVVIKGKPVGAIEVFRDLTRERELEKAKEEFVSLASHQLRTPATGVKAYISMLIDGYAGKLTAQQRAFLDKVFESNERQLQVVSDMLNVARVDAGHIIPEMVSTDIKRLLKDVVDEQRLTIRERQQDLEVTLPEERVELVADPKLIRMVLENLLSNASKYTKTGGVVGVSLKAYPDRVALTVSDTGVGIAKEDLPRLFKRFSRIENPLSTERGGTGLGLYLAHNIIMLHHGRMAVDSELGKGTTFTVELQRDGRRKKARRPVRPKAIRGVRV